MQWFIHCWLCVQQFSFKRRTSTHTQAHSHTHTLRQQAHIRRHKNKFIDWYRLRRASSGLPSCSPAAAACCVLPLPAASEQKNRQNNNGYTHIHTCTHAQQLMPDDWHFTKDTRPRVAKRAKRNKCDAFYLLQLCNRPALPLDPLPLHPPPHCWDSYRYRWSQCQLQLLPPRATDDFRFRCYCWRHSHCLRADGEESQLKCSCKYPGGGGKGLL